MEKALENNILLYRIFEKKSVPGLLFYRNITRFPRYGVKIWVFIYRVYSWFSNGTRGRIISVGEITEWVLRVDKDLDDLVDRHREKVHTITGKLKKKNSAFSPVEKSHEIQKRMQKFIIEYRVKEDGVIKRIQQECFLDRYVTTLRKKLGSLSIDDMITIRGRWKYIEDRKKTKVRGMDFENQMSLSIFLVDRIE